MKRNTATAVVLSGFLFLLSAPAIGHDVSLTPSGDGYVVLYGHGNEWIHYKPEQVVQVTGYDSRGKAFSITPEGKRMMVAGLQEVGLEHEGAYFETDGAGMVTFLFDDGYWTETSDGYTNFSKNHFRDYIKSSHYDMYNKTLFEWSDAYSKPAGLPYEIVPLADPWSGIESLPVQIFHEGSPAAGVEVEINDDPNIYKTDANGKAMIPMKSSGLVHLSSHHEEKLVGDPKADNAFIYSNLIFIR